MAYVKTVWETGDVITAAKLNNAEDGIEDAAPLVITFEYGESGFTTEAVFADAVAAFKAGRTVNVKAALEGESFTGLYLATYQEENLPDSIPESLVFDTVPIITGTGVTMNVFTWTADGITSERVKYPQT